MSDEIIRSIEINEEKVEDKKSGYNIWAVLFGPLNAAYNGCYKTATMIFGICLSILFCYYIIVITLVCMDSYYFDDFTTIFSRIWDNRYLWIILQLIYGGFANELYSKEKELKINERSWKIAFWIIFVVGIINDICYCLIHFIPD